MDKSAGSGGFALARKVAFAMIKKLYLLCKQSLQSKIPENFSSIT